MLDDLLFAIQSFLLVFAIIGVVLVVFAHQWLWSVPVGLFAAVWAIRLALHSDHP